MKDTLGLSCASGGIKHEQWVFSIHPLNGAVVAGVSHDFMIPDVSGACKADGQLVTTKALINNVMNLEDGRGENEKCEKHSLVMHVYLYYCIPQGHFAHIC